jgi:WG containing repeat
MRPPVSATVLPAVIVLPDAVSDIVPAICFFYHKLFFMKSWFLLVLLFPVPGLYAQKWEKNYDYVDNCVCGLAKVKKDGKIGYVNKQGVEIIKPQYQDGLTYNEGYTAVLVANKWRYLDSTGKAITEASYDDAYNFYNGLAVVAKNNQFGFINTAGNIVIPLSFSNAHSFAEGLAAAANERGLWGFIDSKGAWVIKPMYNFANNFENGEARVMKGEKLYYIDRENKTLHD